MMDDVSHFSMVGFPVSTTSAAAFQQSIDPVMRTCALVTVDHDKKLCVVRDSSGAELRIAFSSQGDTANIITANPAFSGEGVTSVDVDRLSPSKDETYSKFEIRVSAKFSGEETPLVFDLADPKQAVLLKPGQKISVDIAAFSFDAKIFTNESAYYKSQKPATVRFAADHFIPIGMFATSVGGLAEEDGPTANADLAGKVLKSESRLNGQTGKKFWWLLVETYGRARFDVVLDAKLLRDKPAAGSIIAGRFWLSGRLVRANSAQ